ncbi:hypothetical protein SESBI_05351 [Sesbania bispinosa]|nr:hypothetical protein SESBI_05351 [Sesbania bispinosa]
MSFISRDEEDRHLLELLLSRSRNKEVVIFNSFNNHANGNQNFSGADITIGSRKQINLNSSSGFACSRKRTQNNNLDDILYIHRPQLIDPSLTYNLDDILYIHRPQLIDPSLT